MAKLLSTIVINAERCKGCDLCVVFCPEHVIGMSDRVNSKGYRIAELQRDGCTGCEICGRICPDMAIEVYREARTRVAAG
jgi:2-oxoglutarate ferredoxin oxidoreductase subunit delta